MKFLTALLAITALLCLTGCTTSQVEATLEETVDAAIAAASVDLPAAAVAILDQVQTTCLTPVAAELASTDTGAAKAAKITADCTAALASLATAGSTLAKVSAALSAFLTAVSETELAMSTAIRQAGAESFFASAKAAKTDHVSAKRLARIREKNKKLSGKLAAQKK
jgi:hypothetical protein